MREVSELVKLSDDPKIWGALQELEQLRQEKTNKQSTFNNYQKAAMRTANDSCKQLANFGMGLSGEAGEVTDIIKKHLFHNHSLKKEDVIKEMGDCLWYLALGCEILKVDFNEVAKINIDKLKNRYPIGFNFNDSINRVDDKLMKEVI